MVNACEVIYLFTKNSYKDKSVYCIPNDSSHIKLKTMQKTNHIYLWKYAYVVKIVFFPKVNCGHKI